MHKIMTLRAKFLPTPSARRATKYNYRTCSAILISTHALREEGDVVLQEQMGKALISTHALREEGDAESPLGDRQSNHFYPRPPRGGRRLGAAYCPQPYRNFYPRPPRGGRRHRPRPGRKCRKISTHALREEGDCTESTGH